MFIRIYRWYNLRPNGPIPRVCPFSFQPSLYPHLSIPSAVAAHTNRQYMFKLNSLFTVDGTTAGNESRYINHASGHNANVRAHGINFHFTCRTFVKNLIYPFLTVRLVNNEHRIGIFACKDIEPGTELLLDYGSDFFNVHSMSTAETQPQSRHLRVQSHDVSSTLSSHLIFWVALNPFCFISASTTIRIVGSTDSHTHSTFNRERKVRVDYYIWKLIILLVNLNSKFAEDLDDTYGLSGASVDESDCQIPVEY